MLNIQELSNGALNVSFAYNKHYIDNIKKFDARFNWSDKSWTVPTNRTEAFLRWAENFKPKFAQNVQIGEIDPMPELDIEIPLLRKLFPYQSTGVAYALTKKRVIVGDQPGLGKTGQAIATTVGANSKCVLIICPATIRENWKREVKIWTGKDSLILTDKVKNTWHTFYQVGMIKYFICNYESLKKYFVEKIEIPIDPKTGEKKRLRLNHIKFKETINLFDTVIIDEVHRCKDGSTQQSKYCMGIAKGKEYVLALTGTPIVNKPKDLFPQLTIIDKVAEFGGYKGFVDTYCQGTSQASNLKQLNYLLHKHCFYRREKTEVLKDLPDKLRNIYKADITNRQEYNFAEQRFREFLEEKGIDALDIDKKLKAEALTQMMELKKISARGKVVEVIEHINEVVEAGEKIVVFAWHKEIVMDLKAAIPGSVTIVGDNSMEQRQIAVDSFQNDPKVQVIICNIKSGGVGITLTASSRVAFIELPWHPADCEQCEDRCHRIGQKDSVQCTYFLGSNTIDEYIYEIIDKKRAIVNQVTGAEADVETKVFDEFINLFMNKKTA
jgi:SWI/SNF-related matrix-associated actin-dependent regulator of chromatin subfamily A-like protein 1